MYYRSTNFHDTCTYCVKELDKRHENNIQRNVLNILGNDSRKGRMWFKGYLRFIVIVACVFMNVLIG